jgi:type I restriction enzyme S subunit
MKMHQPIIRFPNYEGSWEYSKLSERMTIFRGASPRPKGDPRYYGGSVPRLMIKDVTRDGKFAFPCIDFLTEEGARKSRPLKKGSLVLSCSGTRVAIPGILGIDACIHDGWISFKEYKEVEVSFLYNQFEILHEKLQGSATKGGVFNNLTTDIMRSIKVGFPSVAEQQEISSFISIVDKKIGLLKQKHEQLMLYKKGIMQQLFSQKLRFKDDDGQDFPGWEVTKFKQHFERVTQKNKINNLNVLTISGQRGLINQQKYFNKSVSAQNVTGYYLMNKGEFAYNKSYSKGYPMGAIKRLNNYDQGVVSTLYICFKSKNGDDRFWEQYFEAGLLNREIQKIAQEGARNHGLLNVSVKEFFDDMKMHSPSEDEQTKIADFLESIDQKINLAQQQIEQAQAYKQGLLQQMFV